MPKKCHYVRQFLIPGAKALSVTQSIPIGTKEKFSPHVTLTTESTVKKISEVLGCSSVVEHLPRMCETLDLIPSTTKEGRKGAKEGGGRKEEREEGRKKGKEGEKQ